MFCNNCGLPIAAEESVCSRCGSSTTRARVANAARIRVAEHLHLLAILWLVLGAFSFVTATVMGALSAVVAATLAAQGSDRMAIAVAPAFFVVLCVVFAVSAALHCLAGWGLLKTRPWGRTFALVMGFLNLIHPPFGTALGIYTLFVLLPDAAGDEYAQMVRGSARSESNRAVAIAG